MNSEIIDVLLVDDHPIVREGIRSLLADRAQIRVVGEAADGTQAIEQVRRLRPQVVVMDIGLPEINGLEVTRRLSEETPDTRVVILTVYDNREYIVQALRCGALGYIVKNSPSDDLVRAIETVHRGELCYPGRIAADVLRQLATQGPTDDHPEISPRERQVLALVAEGFSNREIASRLELGIRTVETHREHISQKLELHSVAELTKYAIAHGLAQIDQPAGGLPFTNPPPIR